MRRLIMLLPLLPLSAWAQSPTALQPIAVPETVVTATGVPTPAERVPASVTVIDRATIEERGYTTLAEAMSTVPGMRLVQSGGMGQQASGFLRGTNSRHVLVLLDGVPINDPADANGAFNFGNELLGDIERIEIMRGPASALYGTSAIGGVINMITRRAPTDRQFQPFGEVAGGSNNTVRGLAGAAGTVGIADYMVMGQSLSTRGSNATAPRFFDNKGERDGFRGAVGTVRLGLQPTPTTRVEGLLRWRENHFGLDNVPLDDPNYTGEDRRWYGQIRAETRPVEAWTTSLRFSATEDRRRYVNLADVANPFGTTDDYYRGTRTMVEWANQVRLPDLGAMQDVVLSFGASRTRESVEQTSGSAFFQTTTDAAANSTGLQAALQFRLLERLDIAMGIRNESADDYDDATTWRLGATFALPEVNSRLKASVGTAFAAPSLYQRYGRIAGFFEGNPDLKPEHSSAWEVGFETDIPLAGRSNFATFGATYFRNDVRDLINYNAFFDSLENVDKARIQGGEISLTMRPLRWAEASVGWTITDAKDAKTDRPLARRPENVVSVAARLTPIPKVVIAPEVLFTGRSPEGAFASYANDGSSYTTPRYNKSGTVLNLTVSWQAMPTATVFLEGKNLGNSRYEPANGFVIPGRTAVAGVRMTF